MLSCSERIAAADDTPSVVCRAESLLAPEDELEEELPELVEEFVDELAEELAAVCSMRRFVAWRASAM